eukprot:59282-Hanusia_phi.AAC.1
MAERRPKTLEEAMHALTNLRVGVFDASYDAQVLDLDHNPLKGIPEGTYFLGMTKLPGWGRDLFATKRPSHSFVGHGGSSSSRTSKRNWHRTGAVP